MLFHNVFWRFRETITLLREASKTVPRPKPLTILLLDGSKHHQQTISSLSKGFVAQVVSVRTVASMVALGQSTTPDIAILGADHDDQEKDEAERILKEINPRIAIIRM